MREKLADFYHNQWAGWTQYMFQKCPAQPDGSVVIPPDLVARWIRQMNTDYADLPESEKESDRAEADKALAILNPPPTLGETLLAKLGTEPQPRDWGEVDDPSGRCPECLADDYEYEGHMPSCSRVFK